MWRRGAQWEPRRWRGQRATRIVLCCGARAGGQARFVYVRTQGHFIGAAAPPPKPCPSRIRGAPHATRTHPFPAPPPAPAGCAGAARRVPLEPPPACCANLCRGAAGWGLRPRAVVWLCGSLQLTGAGASECAAGMCAQGPGGGLVVCVHVCALPCVCMWTSLCL